ncbi:MAG: response regulator [Gammaproteobacteria bacterium]|nr:response regulator [Gammaproteobacteria bacterium]
MAFNLRSFFSAAENTSDERRDEERIKLPDNATILIVDDSRTAIAVLKKTLAPTGYDILSAEDGEEGIAMAKLHQPDLILMDIIMPGLNGFQATRILRKDTDTQDIPIVIISGNEQATEKFWGLRVGANGFLAKPVDRAELFHLLREHLPNAEVV